MTDMWIWTSGYVDRNVFDDKMPVNEEDMAALKADADDTDGHDVAPPPPGRCPKCYWEGQEGWLYDNITGTQYPCPACLAKCICPRCGKNLTVWGTANGEEYSTCDCGWTDKQ